MKETNEKKGFVIFVDRGVYDTYYLAKNNHLVSKMGLSPDIKRYRSLAWAMKKASWVKKSFFNGKASVYIMASDNERYDIV